MAMTEKEFQATLDARNEATKVWIQAETQTRAYCHQLEKQIAAFEATLKECMQRLGKHHITCYYCGKLLHTIERMATTEVYPSLDCLTCRGSK